MPRCRDCGYFVAFKDTGFDPNYGSSRVGLCSDPTRGSMRVNGNRTGCADFKNRRR